MKKTKVKVTAKLIEKLLEYVWDSEEKHYEELKASGESTSGHIFKTIKKLNKEVCHGKLV